MGFINNSAFGGPEPDQGMNNGFGGQNQGMGNGFGNFDNNGMMNNGQPMMQQQPMMDQNMISGQQMPQQPMMDQNMMNGQPMMGAQQPMNNGYGNMNQGMNDNLGGFDNNGMMNNGQPMMDQNVMSGQQMPQQPMMDQGMMNNVNSGMNNMGMDMNQPMNNGYADMNQGMNNNFGGYDNMQMMGGQQPMMDQNMMNGQPMMQQQPMMDQNMMGGQPMMGAQPQMTPQQLMDPSGMNGGYNQFQGVDNNPKKGKFDIKIVLVIAGVALVALALLSTLVFSKTLKCTNETEFGGVKITMTSKAKYWFGNLSYVEAIVEADFSEFEGDDDQREEAMKAYKTGLETGDDVEIKESGMKITVSKKSSEINEDTFEEEPTYEELKEYFEDDDFTCK